jgi:hypothetical protein
MARENPTVRFGRYVDDLERREMRRVALRTVAGLSHPLAEPPGLEPEPQAAAAAEVDDGIADRIFVTPAETDLAVNVLARRSAEALE